VGGKEPDGSNSGIEIIDEGDMTEFNPQSDPNATPEDVATLYSWANLHGAKYRDFSAARAQTREKARLRAEQALEEEQRPTQEDAHQEDAHTEARRAAEEEYLAVVQARQQEQARRAELAAETAAREAERAAAQQGAEEEAHRVAQEAAEQAARLQAEYAARQAAQAAAELAAKQAAEQAEWQAQELRAQEQRAREQRAQELSAQEQRDEELRAEEQRAQEQRAQELRAQEQRAQEQRIQELREREQRAQELLIQEQRAQEQRAQELRAQEQRVQESAAQLAAQQVADRAAEQAALAAAQHLAQQRATWQQLKPQFETPPAAERLYPAAPAAQQAPPNYPPLPKSFADYGQPQSRRPQPSQQQYGPAGEEAPMPRNPWATPELREPAGRPAWLSGEAPEAPAPYLPASSPPLAPSSISASSVPLAPEDTLQGSRDRLTSRWFALRGVFEGIPVQPEAIPAPQVSRTPAMAVFSLAGGVGKTSLVATLGRALSARGERVLLVDTAAFGLLPFFFGATDQRPGLLRTFSPPGVSSDAPIQMVTIDPDGLGTETPESLSGEISKFARGASRIIVDLATASGATTRRIMRMSPLVLVPVVPDMNSVVSVSSIDAFFEHNSNPAGKPVMPFYVLSQFDASLPLHLDVREVLREQLGERLLSVALRRTPAMSEALAEGMTVMDYAPGSPLAEDFTTLAGWVKSLSSPAITSYRGVRWSER
jgi:cellulose synthase operon protein YhjQ